MNPAPARQASHRKENLGPEGAIPMRRGQAFVLCEIRAEVTAKPINLSPEVIIEVISEHYGVDPERLGTAERS